MTDDRSEFTANRDAGLVKRHEQRLARADIAVIREALDHLPATCRYHGDNVESPFANRSCCDTGKPALARLYAERALWRLARD